jgi:hypothetical protein
MAWVNESLDDTIPIVAVADHEIGTWEKIAFGLFRDGRDIRLNLSGLLQKIFGSKIGVLGVVANGVEARVKTLMHLDASIRVLKLSNN